MAVIAEEDYRSVRRVRIWYAVLLLILAVFVVRLFYLQVIQHDYYKNAALSDQLKQYEIPASRGTILARDGEQTLPIVMNQKLYTLYADPAHIKDAPKAAADVARIIGGNTARYEELMRTRNSRYVILAKKLTPELQARIMALEHPGLGTQRQDYRTYPQGTLASQLLGFVNEEGRGTYGIEQELDKEFRGTSGELKAITDVRGVPLAASAGNTQKPAKPGRDVVLTVDVAMQKQLETILMNGVKRSKAQTGNALIMDVQTGAVKAMANYPSYDPAKYYEVENGSLFANGTVSNAIEVGSIMKPLTTVAALDARAVKKDQTYHDPAKYRIDDFTITNIEEDGGPGTRSITDILNLSLNTGVTWLLMQMGGGTINQKARSIWYEYMTDKFRLGKPTGVEQGYEAAGFIPRPENNGAGINLTYANTAFGQAMTATPIQMAAALSAVLNGGTYHKPHLIEQFVDANGKREIKRPEVIKRNVVSKKASAEVIPMMQYIIEHRNLNPKFDQSRYMVGGKTGTAQIAKPGGGYYKDDYNGTYLGFVGGATPKYVIVVFVEKPKVPGYAGSAAAQPIFVDTARMLINNSFVSAKR